jgi:hypothetical protein
MWKIKHRLVFNIILIIACITRTFISFSDDSYPLYPMILICSEGKIIEQWKSKCLAVDATKTTSIGYHDESFSFRTKIPKDTLGANGTVIEIQFPFNHIHIKAYKNSTGGVILDRKIGKNDGNLNSDFRNPVASFSNTDDDVNIFGTLKTKTSIVFSLDIHDSISFAKKKPNRTSLLYLVYFLE